ncbi:MAG: Electron transfer flavoprotein-ubiquinone oxidoreductase [Syntrophorhabdaceae bacterium PtaU1.Bin034]|jgi:electron transfer flavoprotein-quinone oxidoreductase|nr:MAG: Electron transfer flavoprotein-ubiquinone oxidoreductase [Syntrophorhabdaceae bacterium PtaU1.Bin034]
MGEQFDVAIVGAGPAGSSAASILGGKGVKTIVFERGEYPGAKNMSGGVLYGHDLARIIPDFPERNCPIERNIVESQVWYLSGGGGYTVRFRDEIFQKERRLNSFTVGRAKFDRWFAEQARGKGALMVPATVVTDLLRDSDNRVIGVRTDRPDGEVRAKVVLLADGINSPLAAKTGFRPEVKPDQVALAVKDVVELPEDVINERFNVETGSGVTVEAVGTITKGMDGIGVIYTNKNSLSVCIGANLSDLVRRKIRPYEMLEEFEAHPMVAPLLKDGRPREYMGHWIAEAGYDAIPQLCGNGYLIAGDSGMLFNALHREGSNMAMTSGRLAAEAIIEAFERGDFTRGGLSGYIGRLQESYVMADLRKYRGFNAFRLGHHELFTTLPDLASYAAREMLTVDGTPKKQKQRTIWKRIRSELPPSRLFRLFWKGWRTVK